MKKLTTDTERITNRSNKSFASYLSEIQNFEPLSPDDEFQLSMKMVDGDRKAKDKLIKHNLRFVVSVAKQYYGNNVALEDLVNEGNIGLLLAAERFDPSKGFKFISYAVWWIRKTIMEFLSNKGEAVRVPVSKQYIIGKIKEQYVLLTQDLNREPTENELYESMGGKYNEDEIKLFFTQYIMNNELLDDMVGGENEGKLTKSDLLINEMLPHTDSIVNYSDLKFIIKKYVDTLKPNQKQVITKYFGVCGEKMETLDAIGMEMGITKERVRQLREESLKILKSKGGFNGFDV